MSSFRPSEATQERVAPRSQWIVVKAPEAAAEPKPSGAVLSLVARRRGLRDGVRRQETVEFPDAEYGSGDAGLASDIESDMDSRWDD